MTSQITKNDSTKKKVKKSSNRPVELSATRPVGRFRQVVEIPSKNVRDPRFDHFCGKFNEDLFKKSYKFVEDYKEQELEKLKSELKKTKDEVVSKQLQIQLDKELARRNSEKIKDARAELKREIRKEERELIAKGKKPFYLKKGALRQIELTKKFNEAKGKSNFDKLLEKRRKRNATKEHKLLPFKRHQE